jgi:phosphorylase kinase alpha/beta subunit
MLVIQNTALLPYLKQRYSHDDVAALYNLLEQQGCLRFPPLSNGLFSAALLNEDNFYTGYDAVWVRDNVFVAYALYQQGETVEAARCMQTLATWLRIQQKRFNDCITRRQAPADNMQRPHIRFDGRSLMEIDQPWSHAQNDALGYFLWLFCQLIERGDLQASSGDWHLLATLVSYFEAIAYWQDAESGHWEEEVKIEASSIGAVVAGLQALHSLLSKHPQPDYLGNEIELPWLRELQAAGETALEKILPHESIETDTYRDADAALLYLIYPLKVARGGMADLIVRKVTTQLQGAYGIRRYLDDTFWCRDYKALPAEIRASDSADRQRWFAEQGRALQTGEEAQWCLFDPIVSVIYGEKYRATGQDLYFQQQCQYFNRALGQITPAFRCPELYYLQNGEYIAGDVVPLLWTQANLLLAFQGLQQSLS